MSVSRTGTSGPPRLLGVLSKSRVTRLSRAVRKSDLNWTRSERTEPPSRPPSRHGSSARVVAATSPPRSSSTRKRPASRRKSGGSGTPKLTTSSFRSSARPTSVTSNSRPGRGIFSGDCARAARPASAAPISRNSLRENPDILRPPSALQPQQARGVLPVDFAQNPVGQPQPVNLPAPLRGFGRRGVVEVLVLGLKEPVVDFVQLVAEDLLRRLEAVGHGVGAEENSVLIPVEELTRGAGLAPKLADARADLDRGVPVAVEPLRDPRQVFGVADVQVDEVRARVARDDAVARLVQLAVRGEVVAVERPVGVRAQLLVALVVLVGREEERLGVGGVDGDGEARAAGRLPHRVEALVVHLDERPFRHLLAQAQPETL